MGYEQTIISAGSSGKCLKITYEVVELDAGGTPRATRKRYTVEPYSFKIFEGEKLLYGYDLGDERTKSFYLNKIVSLRISSTDSALRYPVELS